jgi:hypothetical protein
MNSGPPSVLMLEDEDEIQSVLSCSHPALLGEMKIC